MQYDKVKFVFRIIHKSRAVKKMIRNVDAAEQINKNLVNKCQNGPNYYGNTFVGYWSPSSAEIAETKVVN